MKFTPVLVMLAILLGASFVMGQRARTPTERSPNTDSSAVNLVKTCESFVPDYYAMCAGWMAGLMQGIDASESLKDTRSICFPQGFIQQEELRKIFSKYVAANPKKLDMHVGHVAYQAFLEAFPCKK